MELSMYDIHTCLYFVCTDVYAFVRLRRYHSFVPSQTETITKLSVLYFVETRKMLFTYRLSFLQKGATLFFFVTIKFWWKTGKKNNLTGIIKNKCLIVLALVNFSGPKKSWNNLTYIAPIIVVLCKYSHHLIFHVTLAFLNLSIYSTKSNHDWKRAKMFIWRW